ncbi:MAG: hypothetical protein MUF42_00535 [Cytophagaceae bacterium]|nr:hypothetical protein [Cytophagaceae bacterium]
MMDLLLLFLKNIPAIGMVIISSLWKRKVLLFTNGVDRLFQNEEGKRVNALIDPLIIEKAITDYIYIEKDRTTNTSAPLMRRDFDEDAFRILIGGLTRILIKTGYKSKVSHTLHSSLQDYFSKKGETIPDYSCIIQHFLCAFYAEYLFYNCFYLIIRPRFIVGSEQVATGKMAAALNRGIPMIELQHGLVEDNHPYYDYHPILANYRKELVLPTKIGVFGNFYKDFLLKCPVWNQDQIVAIGYYRMELKRKLYNRTFAEPLRILFPTQWTTYTESLQLIEFLKTKTKELSFEFIIKPHPLEPSHHLTGYEHAVSNSGFEFKSLRSDIYECMYTADLVIGFDSTVLLEAISLGIPVITIATKDFPDGLNSFLNTTSLMEAIKPAKNLDEIFSYTLQLATNEDFRNAWKAECEKLGDYVYQKNYLEKVTTMIHELKR